MSSSPGAARAGRRVAVGLVAAALLVASGVYVATTYEWRAAFALLAHARLAWFFLGGGTAVLAYWVVRALRWRLLMRAMHADAPFVDLYLCNAVGLSLGILTPMQSGEAFKVELLRKTSAGARLPGYGAFALERAADLYAIVAIGIVALLAPSGMHAATVLGVVAFAALPIPAYLLLHRLRLPGRTGAFVETVQRGVGTKGALAALLATTFLGWALVAWGWQLSLVALAIRLDFGQVLGLVSLVSLATLASFVPGGLGIADAGIAAYLIRLGYEPALAQAGGLLLRATTLLIIVLGSMHLLALRARWSRPRALEAARDEKGRAR